MTKRMTKTEKLLRAVRRNKGMTRTQVTRFLLGVPRYNRFKRFGLLNGYWNAQLFGTYVQTGLVEGGFLTAAYDAKKGETVFKVPRYSSTAGPYYTTKGAHRQTPPSLSFSF